MNPPASTVEICDGYVLAGCDNGSQCLWQNFQVEVVVEDIEDAFI